VSDAQDASARCIQTNQCLSLYGIVVASFAGCFIGVEAETEEMRPQWFDIDKIPYSSMWKVLKYLSLSNVNWIDHNTCWY
jgi:hypothetical protein